MATSMKVGQSLPLSIAFLDQNGDPMIPTPALDADPSWSQLSSMTDTLTASGDGMTATAMALAAGTDTVRVQLSVSGQSFEATLDLTVEAVEPTQTLTSIQIIAGEPA